MSKFLLARASKIFILSIFVGLCYFNSLSNGFIGDDNMLIVNNTAYRSWDNFSRLLFKDYIIDIDQILNSDLEFLGSSDVSYRPVKSATHFIDYGIWKLNPFGYHLNNLLLHLANTLFLFFLVDLILKKTSIALFAALLFAVHPIQSETVCSINFRHNLLVNFFLFLSLFSYMYAQKIKNISYLFLSYVLFFLAVFSKESAVIFPLIIMGYDRFIKNETFRSLARGCFGRFLGYWVVLGFFIFTYFFLFPNVVSTRASLFGANIGSHMLWVAHIFSYYLKSFLWPGFIKNLPPLYDGVDGAWVYSGAIGLICILAALYLQKILAKRDRGLAFFLFWFLISYVIVSNIIPFVNPVSFRFMYLPSAGLFVLIAFYVDRVIQNAEIKPFSNVIKITILILCVSWTLPLNAAWKSDHTMTLKMYEDFPAHPRANLFAGMTYYQLGDRVRANQVLHDAIAYGLEDPRPYHFLGMIHLSDVKLSQEYFTKCIEGFPRYAACYSGLGRSYFLQEDYKSALWALNKNRALVHSFPTYGYLIQIAKLQDKADKGAYLIKEAERHFTDSSITMSLKRLSKEDKSALPIDLGF